MLASIAICVKIIISCYFPFLPIPGKREITPFRNVISCLIKDAISVLQLPARIIISFSSFQRTSGAYTTKNQALRKLRNGERLLQKMWIRSHKIIIVHVAWRIVSDNR